jgi:hypothetical protein
MIDIHFTEAEGTMIRDLLRQVGLAQIQSAYLLVDPEQRIEAAELAASIVRKLDKALGDTPDE